MAIDIIETCHTEVATIDRNVEIALFTQDAHSCYIEKFVGETLDSAVLDTGCTKNVCGQSWWDSYLDSHQKIY